MLSGAEPKESEEKNIQSLIPSSLTCPIEMNGELMQFPVRLFCCSYVCEKKSLQTWIDKKKQEDVNQEPTCPFCKTELKPIKVKDKLIAPYLPAREVIRNIEEFKNTILPKLTEYERLKLENEHLKDELRNQIPHQNKIISLKKIQVARLLFQGWLFGKIKRKLTSISDQSKQLRNNLKAFKLDFQKNSEQTTLQILTLQKKLTEKNIATHEEEQIIIELQDILEKRKLELQDYKKKSHEIKIFRYQQINEGLEIFENQIKRLQISKEQTARTSTKLKKYHQRIERYLDHQSKNFKSYQNTVYSIFGGQKLNAKQQENVDLRFLNAINKFDINQIKISLSNGANLNSGSSGLITALNQLDDQPQKSKNIEIIRILLEAGANTNLISPVFFNNREFIRLTPLIYIICAMPRTETQIKLELIDLLVKHQADINATDSRGETALSWAVGFADFHMVSKLLALGAKIEDLDRAVIGGKIGKGMRKVSFDFEVKQIEFLLKSRVNLIHIP